jgi:aspartate kinase
MLVMKYGGTSVKDADAVRRLIEQIRKTRTARPAGGRGPVIVVSAASKVTDALLELARMAVAGRDADAHAVVRDLRSRHLTLVASLIRDPARRMETASEVERELDELGSMVHALSILREMSPRSHDVIASVGELLSSRIIAAALVDAGLPGHWVDARQVVVTNGDHMSAQPLMEETAARCAMHVTPCLEKGEIVVLGGYIGATREAATTTLGRGGSDFSASIVGACLGAAEIQIWTDVDGMLTADPRLVPGGHVVPALSFDEASELAYFGAKVLHPSTILPAMQRGIPVRILNSSRPESTGTRIAATVNDHDERELAAIACKRGVTKIDITSTRMLMAWGFLSRVFAIFEKYRTPVDVVTTSEVAVSLTIDDRRRLDDIVADLSVFAQVTVEDDMAIVCAVGERLRGESALGARVLGALEGFALEMVSQGGSRKNITVVVPDSDAVSAMSRLHERFFTARAAVAVASTTQA